MKNTNKRKYTSLTAHALDRLNERTQLSMQEIMDLLGNRLYVDLGTKPGIHKAHYLIFSEKDKKHYVVIKNPLDGSIVTVLPVEYNPWEVKQKDLDLAKKLMIDSLLEKLETKFKYILSVSYHSVNEGGVDYLKRKKLSTIHNSSHDEVVAMLNMAGSLDLIADAAKKYNLDLSNIHEVECVCQENGDYISIPFKY